MKRKKESSKKKVASMLSGTDAKAKTGSQAPGRSSLPVPRRPTSKESSGVLRSKDDRRSIDNAELTRKRDRASAATESQSTTGNSKIAESTIPEQHSDSEDEGLQFVDEKLATPDSKAKTTSESLLNAGQIRKVRDILHTKLEDINSSDEAISIKLEEKHVIEDAFRALFKDQVAATEESKNKARDSADQALRSPPKKQLEENARQQASINALKRQVSHLETQLKESGDKIASLETDNEEITLDKEIVEEEKADKELQLHSCKNRCEQLEEELRKLRDYQGSLEENEQKSSKAKKSKDTKKNLKSQNWCLREALSKLRNMYVVEVSGLQTELETFRNQASRSSQLAAEVEKQSEEIRALREEKFELLEQLDTANVYEDMIEDLTDKNLALSDRLEELKSAVDDLEDLRSVYEDLEQYYIDNDKLRQMEIAKQQQLIEEYQHRVNKLTAALNIARQQKHYIDSNSEYSNRRLQTSHQSLSTTATDSHGDGQYKVAVSNLHKLFEQIQNADQLARSRLLKLGISITGVWTLQTSCYALALMLPSNVMKTLWKCNENRFSSVDAYVADDASASDVSGLYTWLLCCLEQIIGGLDCTVVRCYEYILSLIKRCEVVFSQLRDRIASDVMALQSILERHSWVPTVIDLAITIVKITSMLRLFRSALLTRQGSSTRLRHTVPLCLDKLAECKQIMEHLVETDMEKLYTRTYQLNSMLEAVNEMQETFTSHLEAEVHAALGNKIRQLSKSSLPSETLVLEEKSQQGEELCTLFAIVQTRLWAHVDLIIRCYMSLYRVFIENCSIQSEDIEANEKTQKCVDEIEKAFDHPRETVRSYTDNVVVQGQKLCNVVVDFLGTSGPSNTAELRNWDLDWSVGECSLESAPDDSSPLPVNMFELFQNVQNRLWQYHMATCVSTSNKDQNDFLCGYWIFCWKAKKPDSGVPILGLDLSRCQKLENTLDWNTFENTTSNGNAGSSHCLSKMIESSFNESYTQDLFNFLEEDSSEHSFSLGTVSLRCTSSFSVTNPEKSVRMKEQQFLPFLKPFSDVKQMLESGKETFEALESARSNHAETVHELEQKDSQVEELQNRLMVMEDRVKEGIQGSHDVAKLEENVRTLRHELDRQRVAYENKLELLESLKDDFGGNQDKPGHVLASRSNQASVKLAIYSDLKQLVERQKLQISWWKAFYFVTSARALTSQRSTSDEETKHDPSTKRKLKEIIRICRHTRASINPVKTSLANADQHAPYQIENLSFLFRKQINDLRCSYGITVALQNKPSPDASLGNPIFSFASDKVTQTHQSSSTIDQLWTDIHSI